MLHAGCHAQMMTTHICPQIGLASFFQFNNICPITPGKIGYVFIARKLTISGKLLPRTTKNNSSKWKPLASKPFNCFNGHKAASNSLLLCTE